MIGFLLVGGEGRRLGGNKLTQPYRGLPLWSYGVRLLEELCSCVVLLGRAELAYPQWLESEPGQGPLGGMLRALRQAPEPWCVLLAVDYPELPAEAVLRLCAAWESGDRALMPVVGEQAHPLCGVYHRELAEPLGHRYAQGERSVLRALEGLVRPVPFAETGWFHNVNRPTDLR